MDERIEIQIYEAPNGRLPYVEWEKKLSPQVRAIVTTRLARVRIGNFGSCKQLKNANGILELKIDFGPGYRIYFGKMKNIIVILLCGGDKSTQTRDIQKAKQFWEDYCEKEKKISGKISKL